jgi:hypothetical protein
MPAFETPQDVLKTWIDRVNALDLKGILELYADNASLLPTFSPHVADTQEKLAKYFTQLASRDNMSVSLHQRTVQNIPIRDGIHAIVGTYHFAFDVDEDPLTFASRFTMVIDLNQQSPIVQHHSSQVPRTLS